MFHTSELLDPQNTNQDDLMQYWDKFVDDVKCTRGGPDYGERNPSPNIFFEYRTVAQIASGVTPDHIAYSTFSGYCNDRQLMLEFFTMNGQKKFTSKIMDNVS